jgi:hypothetical protein
MQPKRHRRAAERGRDAASNGAAVDVPLQPCHCKLAWYLFLSSSAATTLPPGSGPRQHGQLRLGPQLAVLERVVPLCVGLRAALLPYLTETYARAGSLSECLQLVARDERRPTLVCGAQTRERPCCGYSWSVTHATALLLNATSSTPATQDDRLAGAADLDPCQQPRSAAWLGLGLLVPGVGHKLACRVCGQPALPWAAHGAYVGADRHPPL